MRRLRVPSLTGRRRPAAIGLAAALVIGGLAISACGDRQSRGESKHSGTAFLQAARCADWRRSDESERHRTIRALTLAATKPDPENDGATLSDARAYQVLQRACSTEASRSAVLYEIYNRAAAFQSLGR